MADIFTTDVRLTVDIDGVTMHATRVETNRTIGPSAGTATIEGYSESPGDLELDQQVTVYMGTDTDTGRAVRNKLFQGKVKKATQNEEGLITVECYDERVELHGKYVKYTNEEPIEAWNVLNDILFDAGYVPALNYDNVFSGNKPPSKQPHIVDPDNVPGEPTVGKHAYGSGRRGEPLSNVLADLATKLGCRMWVDKNNVINIVPYPEHSQYEAKYITKINSGDETVNQDKVLVQGGTPASSIGPAAASVYDQTRIQSDATSGDEQEREFQYSDDNIITQEEANRAAASNQYDREMSRQVGEIEIVGNPTPELFDVVRVPELRQADSIDVNQDDEWTQTDLIRAINRPVDDAEYGITGITHVASAQDGYLTTLELGPEPGEAAEQLGGIAGAIANELTDKIEDNKQDEGSILNFLPGFE